MSLIFDARPQLGGAPGLHCLIAGVSHYLHLPEGGGERAERTYGLKQLSSTARSALQVYRWVLEAQQRLPVPLATIRLLLAPSEVELAAEPELANLGVLPTRRNFSKAAREWRTDARKHAGGMTFFYFAGHGVQRRKGDSVLLLHDFGDPVEGPLARAAALDDIYNGMAPPAALAQTVAKRQIYVIDACRMPPAEFRSFEWLNISDIFGAELAGVDDRTTAQFFSSLAGARAYALKGEQTLFSRALRRCLEGSAGVHWTDDGRKRWGVSVYSLTEALEQEIAAIQENVGPDQDFQPVVGKNMPVCWLDATPDVEVVIEVDPANAADFVHLGVDDAFDDPVIDVAPPIEPHPFVGKLPAGIYQLSGKLEPAQPDLNDYRRLVQVQPPGAVRWRIQL